MVVEGNIFKSDIEKLGDPFLLEQVNEIFPENECLDITITAPFDFKTDEQRGYFFASICQSAKIGYHRLGVMVGNKTQVADKLLIDTGFVDTVLDPAGQILYSTPKRISKMSRRLFSEFMDAAIIFCIQDLLVDVETPEEYFKRKGK